MNVNIIMEMTFDMLYLIIIYFLVIKMFMSFKTEAPMNKTVCPLFIAAFVLLAVGDTGHVGFRLIAYLRGGLEANQSLLGAGSFATAATVTVFYMLMAEILRKYTEKPKSNLFRLIIILGIARLLFMVLPGNNWGGKVTPLTYSYIRNAFLTLMGIIVAIQYLKSGLVRNDSTLKIFGTLILISYGFYLPVILFVHAVPLLGMLMIPKTCAYVALAIVGYKRLFSSQAPINR